MSLLSSTTTARPVFSTDASMASQGIGLRLQTSTTSTEMPSVSRLRAAARARWAIRPVAKTETSRPDGIDLGVPETERLGGHAAPRRPERRMVEDDNRVFTLDGGAHEPEGLVRRRREDDAEPAALEEER